uniref:Tryptophan-rich sensory protein n=1 Tax=viral metagenome TaxID=1070528 RepID=A0A6C0DUE3_9ZZZZ
MNDWYKNLKKSVLTPPAYVFGPIWATLYLLMTISLIIYLNAGYTTRGLILFGSQLAINLMWSRLFFGQRLICGSLLNEIIMNILVFFTYVEFKKSSTIAANLLLPYMVWILLAAYLNLYICVNN